MDENILKPQSEEEVEEKRKIIENITSPAFRMAMKQWLKESLTIRVIPRYGGRTEVQLFLDDEKIASSSVSRPYDRGPL